MNVSLWRGTSLSTGKNLPLSYLLQIMLHASLTHNNLDSLAEDLIFSLILSRALLVSKLLSKSSKAAKL